MAPGRDYCNQVLRREPQEGPDHAEAGQPEAEEPVPVQSETEQPQELPGVRADYRVLHLRGVRRPRRTAVHHGRQKDNWRGDNVPVPGQSAGRAPAGGSQRKNVNFSVTSQCVCLEFFV